MLLRVYSDPPQGLHSQVRGSVDGCDLGVDRGWHPDPLVVFRVSEDVENFTDVPFLKTPLLGSGQTGTMPGSPTFGSPSRLFARTHP